MTVNLDFSCSRPKDDSFTKGSKSCFFLLPSCLPTSSFCPLSKCWMLLFSFSSSDAIFLHSLSSHLIQKQLCTPSSCNTPAFAVHYLRGYSLLLQAVFPFPTVPGGLQQIPGLLKGMYDGQFYPYLWTSLKWKHEMKMKYGPLVLTGSLHKAPHVQPGPSPSDKLWSLLVSPIQVISSCPKAGKGSWKKTQQVWGRKVLWDSTGNQQSSTAGGHEAVLQQTNPSVSVQGSPPASWR